MAAEDKSSFKKTVIITIMAASIPVILGGIGTLFTYLTLKDIEHRIQTVHSRSTSLDLYNQLAANVVITTNLSEPSSTIEVENFDSLGNLFKEIIPQVQFSEDIEDEEGALAMIDRMTKTMSKYADESKERVVEESFLVRFDYCVNNIGNVEQFIDLPRIQVKAENSEYKSIRLFHGNRMGVVGINQTSCSNFEVKFLDLISLGGVDVDLSQNFESIKVDYRIIFKSSPSTRSIAFIYDKDRVKDVEYINGIAEQFKMSVVRNGTKEFKQFYLTASHNTE